MVTMNLSARAFHRGLKLARTVADLARSEKIETAHVAEVMRLQTTRTGDVGSWKMPKWID